MRYWNSYFGQWLDDEDNDIPNDMPNDESNECPDDFPEDQDEDEEGHEWIHFTEKDMEWWREMQRKIQEGTLFHYPHSFPKPPKKNEGE